MSNVDDLLETSRRTLEEARYLREGGYHEGSLSRAYYAMFYAAEAALLTVDVTASTHSGVHTMFGKHFVKTGALPAALGKHLGEAFRKRQSADYGAAEKAPADAREALKKATEFIERIEAHLHEQP